MLVNAKELFIATRPWSFPMTVLTITIGTVYAYVSYGIFNLWLYIVTLVGSIFLHAFTNLLNDYFDYKYGIDIPEAPTAKYRPHPIITGVFTERGLLLYAMSYGILGSIIGLYLIYETNVFVGLIGGLGVFIALTYTGPPFKFKYRALGEVVIFIAFGPIMILGAFFVQVQTLNLNVIALSVPIGIMIAAVGYANNMRDIDYDASRGIKTLASLLGKSKSLKLFKAMVIIAYLSVVVLFLLNVLPIWTLISLLSIPEYLKISKLFSERIPENADPIVAKLVLDFSFLFLIGILITPFISIYLNLAFSFAFLFI